MTGLHDHRSDVVRAAINGLGSRSNALALPQLIAMADRVDEHLRCALAFTLGMYGEQAIAALLALAADGHAEVRNWATFSIGSLQEADSPAIRACLWKNVFDPDEDVRGEALVGLAERKDERIIPLLLERLDGRCRVFELNAAEMMASAVLTELLVCLMTESRDARDSYWYRSLLRAIEACGGAPGEE